MLENGPYSDYLKNRIRGPHGHLSNLEAANLLRTAATSRLQWACLAHLSDENNDPAVALQTHQAIVGSGLRLSCADRRHASCVMRITEQLAASPLA